MQGHPVENRRGRRHRILREKLDARREGAEADRLVPGHQVLRLIRIRQSEVQRTAHLLDRGRAELRGRDVLLNDLRLLVPPDVFEGALHMPEVEVRSEEHTSELQSLTNLVCRLLLEKKK